MKIKPTLETILMHMQNEDTYKEGLFLGLYLLNKYYSNLECIQEWEIDYNDISSDYRLLVTVINRELLK